MQQITLPERPIITKQDGNYAVFEIRACYPGYGMTLGNSLRRVLLSSLQGAAITAVKISGVNHEFSAIPGVLEDAVEIMLNLKKVRFKMFSDEPVKLTLKANKEGKVTAGDIAKADNVEVVNKDAHIATITDKKVVLEMEFRIERGVGYVPVEQQDNDKADIGTIGVDAIFTPIKSVNYKVENMRVGKMTNYDRLTLEIETDGSRTPEEAFSEAVVLMMQHFDLFGEFAQIKEDTAKAAETAFIEEAKEDNRNESKQVEKLEAIAEEKKQDVLKTPLDEFNISSRVLKVLAENKIKTVGKVVSKTEEDLSNLPGMGDKGIKEIKKAIGKMGLTLKK
ncbi:MAG: DNA-directed RNA polymerase subunit alpha [Candidatus Pacebacteria bacterium]|nr:DNA-directed RNA polymerase subunit alpha [Candidatus Paceibacterota bacterium]